jgi:hypothetical protein
MTDIDLMKLFAIRFHVCKRVYPSQINTAAFHSTSVRSWRRPRQSTKVTGAKERFLGNLADMGEKTDYSAWSNERLIERVTQLEAELKNKNERLFNSFSMLCASC